MSTLVVASYNPGGGNAAHGGTDADKMTDLDLAATLGFDLLGGQEFGDRHPMLAAWLQTELGTHYDLLMGTNPGAGKVPILYRKDRLTPDLTACEYLTGWEGGWVGKVGAGPTSIGPKVLTHGVFDDQETNRRIHHLNHHLVASHRRAHLPDEERTARRAVAHLQAETWNRVAATTRGQKIGTGDWNAGPTWVNAHVGNFIIDNTRPTHQEAQIDTVGHYPSNVLTKTSETTLETSGSLHNQDHRMPVVTYTLEPKTAPGPDLCVCCGQPLPEVP